MFYRGLSAFLTVLLAGTMVWGRCASCPNIIPGRQEQHSCCAQHHQGRCGIPSPKQPVQNDCPSLALAPESTDAVTLDLAELVAPPLATPAPADLLPAPEFPLPPGGLLVHSPPDLYLIDATLLI